MTTRRLRAVLGEFKEDAVVVFIDDTKKAWVLVDCGAVDCGALAKDGGNEVQFIIARYACGVCGRGYEAQS